MGHLPVDPVAQILPAQHFGHFYEHALFLSLFLSQFCQQLGEQGFSSDRVSAALAPGKRYNHKNNNKKRQFVVIKSSTHHICTTMAGPPPYPKASQFSPSREVDKRGQQPQRTWGQILRCPHAGNGATPALHKPLQNHNTFPLEIRENQGQEVQS